MYKEVKADWFKTTKIGDYVEGTLSSKEWKKKKDMQGNDVMQEEYEIIADAGKWHVTIKENGLKKIDEENPVVVEKGDYIKFSKSTIVSAMKKIKIGQKVKFIFDSITPSKDKMKDDFKLVKVYAGPMDTEYQYNEVLGVTGGKEVVEESSDIKVEDIPFN